MKINPEYKNINRFYQVVYKSLFHVDGTLSYKRTLEAIERLCQVILDTETEETVWYIGEFNEATLDGIIVGAYWFLTDYHAGQESLEYRVLSRLGEIFNPGMSCLEDDSSEQAVYQALEDKFHGER